MTCIQLYQQNKKSLQMQQLVGVLKSIYICTCIASTLEFCIWDRLKFQKLEGSGNQEWPLTFIVSKSNMGFPDWEGRQLKKKLPESSVEVKISVHHVQTDKSDAWNGLEVFFVGVRGLGGRGVINLVQCDQPLVCWSFWGHCGFRCNIRSCWDQQIKSSEKKTENKMKAGQ